ncbi:nucleotidyl transferase AbiEii/AbiGii toxin family protein [uncultured Thiodictyon sp.]|uniref:nucleotidyl transferase AbiEii/AbiGii toxin family protein n=2 Tax=uncultured Thiodictyon sp. TaxID=1846217 RepID=UPI0025D97B92|nr:nucleotidyl transferase AbiEii/AbiGii toxin family protein [uncultured Thiodictyon sp.]
MDKVARFSPNQRRELFFETAAKMAMTPAVAEKDFWVTWILDRLFREPQISRVLMFKGGTSLSKVYRLIERFSEDIDLILDWRELNGEDPLADRSKSKQAKLNDAIDAAALTYIGGPFLELVAEAMDGVCTCQVESNDPHVIAVTYPAAFSDKYLRPEVRLEIGPLASWLPHEDRRISCYAAEMFPKVFDRSESSVRVIKAQRTFWEKATILHHEAYRPEGSPQPSRYSRHYYDLTKMAESPVKALALADTELLASVVAFKQRFYPRGWARYELAKPGSLRLVPSGTVRDAVEADYRAMAEMIFGDRPAFADIMTILHSLQEEINRSAT